MCYHVSVVKKDALEARYQRYVTQEVENALPIYHASGFNHPGLPVITNREPDKIQLFQWGLLPSYAKEYSQALDLSNQLLNAKSETIWELRSFRDHIGTRRCLVTVEGFYEWMDFKGKKYPHYVHMKNGEPFSMGGIWNTWHNRDTGEEINSFSIITTAANPLMARIHNLKLRMPLILPFEAEELWLAEHASKEDISRLMQPLAGDDLEAFSITKRITDRKANPNVPEVMERCAYPELTQVQTGLFNFNQPM